jgi:hypothetical protein
MFGLIAFGSPTLLLPYVAMREIKRFKEKQSLNFSIFNSLVVLALFWPMALFQMYLIYQIKQT